MLNPHTYCTLHLTATITTTTTPTTTATTPPLHQVLEVKTMEGLGTTVDVVLINGTLREGDRMVVCGLGGPIVTRIKSLKTPQVLKEMRVKGALVEHKEVRGGFGGGCGCRGYVMCVGRGEGSSVVT